MAILLDADVVIRGERGSFDLAAWAAARPNDQFCLAAITVAELWHGVERTKGGQRAKRKRFLNAIFSAIPVVPYSERTAFIHAQQWARLQSAGKMIGYYDLIVAATALEHGCELATFNIRHFEHVKGLRAFDPTRRLEQ